MIPASYLFKNIYHQHWEQEQPEPKAPEQHKWNGVTTPIWERLAGVLHRSGKPGRRYYGVHAYD
jgi:hypothetical protein